MSKPLDARSEAIRIDSLPLRKAVSVLRPEEVAVDLVKEPMLFAMAGRSIHRSRAKRSAFSLLLVNISIP